MLELQVMLMKTVIRALGWATYIFWIILLFFSVTAAYSAFQLGQGFALGEPRTSTSNGTVTMSLPFYINNVGFYDIANLNFKTSVRDRFGAPVSDSSTFVQLIPRGDNSSITHNITLNANSMTSSQLSHLLFADSNLTVEASLKLDYAKIIPFEISTNFTMPWGAPLHNLTIGRISMSGTRATVPFSFENHSFFELNGTMRLEIVDNLNQIVGQGTALPILAPPQSSYWSSLDVTVSGDPANIRTARLYFQTSVFSYGPVVIPLA